MGRRSLRKIPANCDLSHHSIELEALPGSWEACAWVGAGRPLELEVGSGKGLFLASAATSNPDRSYLGIEVARKYAQFTAARLARLGLTNAWVLHGDAEEFLVDWVPEASIAAVHIYFPDPWWKKRHHKRRIFNARFVQHVERVLRPSGRLHFWTDVEDYFRGALEQITTATELTGPFVVSERPAEHDLDYRTHFERRTRLAGQAVFRAEFIKAIA